MRRIFTAFLVCGLLLGLAGCNERDLPAEGAMPTDAPEEQQTPVSQAELEAAPQEVYNAVYGYTLTVPDVLAEHCTVVTSEDGAEIQCLLKQSGDFVAAVCAAAEKEPFQLGERELARGDGCVVYLQLPTCGTLNQEQVRELWQSMVDETEQLQADAIQFSDQAICTLPPAPQEA